MNQLSKIVCTNCEGKKVMPCYCNGQSIKVKNCFMCSGSGVSEGRDCWECSSKGIVRCRTCDGRGREYGSVCLDCRGRGYTNCVKCDGAGKLDVGLICKECKGSGNEILVCGCDNGIRTCDTCKGEGEIPDPVESAKLKEAQRRQAQEEQERAIKRQKSVEEYNERQRQAELKKDKWKRLDGLKLVLIIVFFLYYIIWKK